MLKGKTAVVTGASGGMGAAICHLLAQSGARIVAMDISAELSSMAVKRLADSGFTDAIAVAADISSASAVSKAFVEIEQLAGPVHILINNAGMRQVGGALDLTPQEWDRVMAVNLNGPFYCAREAALRMRASGGGCIVNIASVAGLVAIRNRAAYTSSKHGLVGLTRSLAFDLAPYNIRVNAVAPGTIKTAMTEAYFSDPDFLQGLTNSVALGSRGTPESVARAVLFLCSEQSDFVTGITLPVDGGFMAEKSFTSGNIASFVASSR